jgi:hypothetical protein
MSIPTATPSPMLTKRKEIKVSILKYTTSKINNKMAAIQSSKGINKD